MIPASQSAQPVGPDMRVSHYSVVSGPLDDGSSVVLNTTFGTLDRIPGDEANLFDSVRRLDPPVQHAALQSLPAAVREALAARGHLTDRTEEAGHEFADAISDALHAATTRLPAFLIVPNLDCNYRCTCCFERPLQRTIHTASTDIRHHRDNVVMTPALADAAFRAIDAIEADSDRKTEQLVLYGGEPLDRRNLAVVRHIVGEAKRRGKRFSAISSQGHWPFLLACSVPCAPIPRINSGTWWVRLKSTSPKSCGCICSRSMPLALAGAFPYEPASATPNAFRRGATVLRHRQCCCTSGYITTSRGAATPDTPSMPGFTAGGWRTKPVPAGMSPAAITRSWSQRWASWPPTARPHGASLGDAVKSARSHSAPAPAETPHRR